VGLRRRRDVLLALVATPAARGQTLEEHRSRIDDLDRRIVALLNERAEVVGQIARLKRETGLPVTVPAREREVFRNVTSEARALPADSVRRIYERILVEMKAAERAAMRRRGEP